jgi:hypothetical protein
MDGVYHSHPLSACVSERQTALGTHRCPHTSGGEETLTDSSAGFNPASVHPAPRGYATRGDHHLARRHPLRRCSRPGQRNSSSSGQTVQPAVVQLARSRRVPYSPHMNDYSTVSRPQTKFVPLFPQGKPPACHLEDTNSRYPQQKLLLCPFRYNDLLAEVPPHPYPETATSLHRERKERLCH